MNGDSHTAATVFGDALSMEPRDRSDFLDRVCGDDEALRREVNSLLAAHDHAAGFLATPALAGTQAVESSEVPPALERVGAYRCLSLIGVGGMGEVYLAERCDETFDKRVAIKVIRAGTSQQSVMDRFNMERMLLARLEHPNIARLLDGGTTSDGRPYIVMEYVDGRSIAAHCDATELDLRDRLQLFLQVCDAVQHAHRNLIVHRDLKPSNILISGDSVVKLLDFGIAKLVSADEARSELTITGMRPFTPRYASPEQVDHQPVTTATDVYSLGVVLYELVTGVPPYDLGVTSSSDYRQVIRESIPRKPSTAVITSTARAPASHPDPRRLGRQLAGDLDTIILTALRKEPERRYDSAAMLADDIRRYLDNRPITARPASLVYETRMFVRRNRGLVAGGMAMLALLMLGIIGMSWERSKAIEARDTAAAINDFLINDLLVKASPTETPDRDLTLRAALDSAAGRIGDRFDDKPVVKASILHALGNVYWRLGEYDAATPLLEEATAHRQRKFGPAHDDTIDSRRSAAAVALEAGRLDEAAGEFRSMIALLESSGRGDSILAHSLRSDYGLTLVEKGDFDEAEKEYEVSVEALKRLAGIEDPLTLSAMVNLAQLVSYRATPERSIPMFQELIEVQRRVYGDEHPDTVTTLNNIGMAYINMRQHTDAEPYFVDAVAVAKRVLGAEHPDTLIIMNNLALAYHGADRNEDAAATIEEVVRISESIFDRDHPNLIQARNNLAFMYFTLGRVDEAIDLEKVALRDRQRVLGPTHPNTLNTLNNVGFHLSEAGRHEEALPYLQECLTLRRDVLQPGDLGIYLTWNNLGRALFELGRIDETVEVYRAAVADVQALSREPDHTHAILLQGLGKSLKTQGESLDEAEAALREAHAILTAVSPDAPEIPVLEAMLEEF